MFKLSLKLHTLLPVVWFCASYVNRTHVNSLEGCYATTTPTMLTRLTIEEINFRNFKQEFFITHFLSVTSRKNIKKFFEKRSELFANQTNLFSLIESCCCFWFVSSQGQCKFKKRQEFIISWVICPSNAYNSKVQSLPENKNSFIARLSLCIVRKSNPCLQLISLLRYHYNNDAEKMYDRRDEHQNFQTWILPYKYSECHIKKNQNYSLRRGRIFFANQINFFLINRKLSFLVCYFSRTLGIQKETRIYYFTNVLSLKRTQ